MCGIVGCAGAIGIKEEKLFKQLLILDSLRGEHSTGVAAVHPNKEISISKVVGDPFQLFDTENFKKILRRQSRVLIGHNRYATTGAVNRANAHPFEFDSIVGVHNGTLTNKYSLPETSKFDVDSQALYNLIDKEGIEEAIPQAQGAWALCYYDKDFNTLNFLRNDQRPLWFLMSEDKKCLFWASEAWMLTAALSRDGYKYDKLFELPKDMLFTFDIDLNAQSHLIPEFKKPKGKKVEGKKPVAAQSYHSRPLLTSSPITSGTPHTDTTKPASSVPKEVSAYIGSDVILIADSLERDDKGAKYVKCKDFSHPTFDVRVYYHENDLISKKLGAAFSSKISQAAYNNGKIYFKISPWSVEFNAPIPEEKEIKSNVKYVPTLHGQTISKEVFDEKYCMCDWCSSVIAYGDKCYVYREGVLCEDCMKDESLFECVPGLSAAVSH